MTITVEQALKLRSLRDARVIGGKKGLNREISRISVAECPEFPIDPAIDKNNLLFKRGDFFITSFFAIKDYPQEMLKTIQLYNEFQSSGLCVIDLYVKELASEIINYANKYHYPIIQVSRQIPYADIINDVMEAIIQNKEDIIIEMKINNILYSAKTDEEIKEIVYSINRYFKKYFISLYVQKLDKEKQELDILRKRINRTNEWIALKYKNGFLIILTFETYAKKSITTQLEFIIYEIKNVCSQYHIGISNVHIVEKLNHCINEALIACDLAKIEKKSVIHYNESGIYRLLMMFRQSEELKTFHDSIIMPLKNYDATYHTELFKTAYYFVQHDGNLKKTAEEMFQHENTIRYRLMRIKEILNMEDANIRFYEQLSMAIKINKILFDQSI